MTRFPLQVTVTPEDTAAVSHFESSAREAIEHIATTPLEQLLPELAESAIRFGIKVLIALLIYFIGAWVIKKIRGVLRRIFERRKTEKAIASFVESLTSISLTIILVIITVGTLGVNTTSLAALLAAGGMAIGMALSGTVQNFAGGIMILVGWYVSRKVRNSEDYLMAGRALSYPMVVATVAATWYGSGAVFGTAELAFNAGIAAFVVWCVPAHLGRIPLALWVASRGCARRFPPGTFLPRAACP